MTDFICLNKPVKQFCLAVAVMVSACTAVSAQLPDSQISLMNMQCDLGRLAPGTLQTSLSFQIDDCSLISFVMTATSDGVGTSIEMPDGQIFDPMTIGNLGGTYVHYEGNNTGEPDFMIGPQVDPGYHDLYDFPAQGSGTYTVHLTAPLALAEEVAIFVCLQTDSPVRTTLFATKSTAVVGETVALTAVVLEGTSAMVGATVAVTVMPPTAASFPLPLLDNGVDADFGIGDGLYGSMPFLVEIANGSMGYATPSRQPFRFVCNALRKRANCLLPDTLFNRGSMSKRAAASQRCF